MSGLKLSSAQVSKYFNPGQFLWSLLSKLAGPLMKVTVPFAKNIWASLGITLATSVIDAEIQKTTWFRDNAFNNFKQGNERDNKNRSGILIFSWKEWVEQLKMKQKNKKKKDF